jgi:transcriptional regulator with XRE-family HTH domain
MYIQDFTGDPATVLDTAFASPKLNPKKAPDIETALRVVNDTVAKQAVAGVAKEVLIDLMDAVAMYEINNGEYGSWPEGDAGRLAKDEYESGMDDVVEASFEKWDEYLSADWLGKNTIDTGVWNSTDDDRTIVENLAASAAKEIFKQMTHEKTPAQTLANAGITRADIEARLAQNPEERKETMADATDLDGVIEKIKTHVGKDFDQMAVFEDIEMIVEDEDDILSGSAASRLGLSQADMEVLQLAALDMDDAPSEIVELIDAFKPKSGRQAKKEEKAAKTEAKADAEQNGLDPSIFEALKECGAGDTAMAEALGVSRSTYTNYVKGKTHLVPDEDQYAHIREQIIDRTNMLLSALAALDGTELTQVA